MHQQMVPRLVVLLRTAIQIFLISGFVHRSGPPVLDSLKLFILANKRRRSSVASLGNRHDGKKGKKQKHVNKKNDIFPHGNYRQYYGNVERKFVIPEYN